MRYTVASESQAYLPKQQRMILALPIQVLKQLAIIW